MNLVVLMGRLTKDPELRFTKSQTPVCSFCVAVDGESKDAETQFIDCVAWNKSAEFLKQYFYKGKSILIIGKIKNREWENKDGEKRKSTEVICDRVKFCGDRDKNASSRHTDESPEDPSEFDELFGADDDIPF